MTTYECLVCHKTFESQEGQPVCPACGATGNDIKILKK